MLKITNKNNNFNNYVHDELEFYCDDFKNENVQVCFNCDDGVSFIDKKKVDEEGFIMDYKIPRGMASQTYHIFIQVNDKKSNEVILKVEKDFYHVEMRYQNKMVRVKFYNDVYPNKRYCSLDDLKILFESTDKAFTFDRLGNNKLIINEKERRYFSSIQMNETYLYITDAMLALNVYFEFHEEFIQVQEFNTIFTNFDQLVQDHYFSYLHGCIVGDIDSGEIFYSENENNSVAIASTSKLLTLYLVFDAIKKKQLQMSDLISISEKAETEALSEDGTVYLKEGMQIHLKEMLQALMLPSSNESAIALGEKLAGSEEQFAKMMNEKCQSLGLQNSIFYNASGLPAYNNVASPSKLQNKLTASEMFKLASNLVLNHPESLEITSLQRAYLPTLDVTLTNTNPLLFNLENCIGLKTGTTTRAACCLVSLCKTKNRRILSVVFGAESSQERGEKSEMLQRYVAYLLSK